MGDGRAKVLGEVVSLPIGKVKPDPAQPREHADADLKESIESQGVLVPISVRAADDGKGWVIVNGERRYRGALAAGLTHVPAIVEEASVKDTQSLKTKTDRLVRQLVTNDGKPLTPLEEAKAYRLLMESLDLSAVKLAKLLGKARSFIGDRVRLLEIPAPWLKLIEDGDLSVSHAPIIARFKAVEPAETIHEQAVERYKTRDYRWKHHVDAGDPIPLDGFEGALAQNVYNTAIKPLSELKPAGIEYRGPTIEVKANSWNSGKEREVFAADRSVWYPLWKKVLEKQKKDNARRNMGSNEGQRTALFAAIKKEYDLPSRKGNGSSMNDAHAAEGEVQIVGGYNHAWKEGLDPAVLMEKIDPKTITIVEGYYPAIVTSDLDAVNAAREAYSVRKKELWGPELLRILHDIEALENADPYEYAVQGLGARHLIESELNSGNHGARGGSPVKILVSALGVSATLGEPNERQRRTLEIADADANRLASAMIAVDAGAVKLPDAWRFERVLESYAARVHFTPGKVTLSEAEEEPEYEGDDDDDDEYEEGDDDATEDTDDDTLEAGDDGFIEKLDDAVEDGDLPDSPSWFAESGQLAGYATDATGQKYPLFGEGGRKALAEIEAKGGEVEIVVQQAAAEPLFD